MHNVAYWIYFRILSHEELFNSLRETLSYIANFREICCIVHDGKIDHERSLRSRMRKVTRTRMYGFTREVGRRAARSRDCLISTWCISRPPKRAVLLLSVATRGLHYCPADARELTLVGYRAAEVTNRLIKYKVTSPTSYRTTSDWTIATEYVRDLLPNLLERSLLPTTFAGSDSQQDWPHTSS